MWYCDKTQYVVTSNTNTNISSDSSSEEEPKTSMIDEIKSRLSRKGKSKSSTPVKYNFALIASFLFLLIITPVKSCESVSIVNAVTETCVTEVGIEACYYRIDTQITLQHLHSVACLDLKNNDGEFIARISIEYYRSVKEITLRKLYYTSDWLPSAASKRMCPGAVYGGQKEITDWCSYWNNLSFGCITAYESPTLTSCQGVTDPNSCIGLVDCFPGEYYCMVGSNKGCGAFDYGDAYVFGKYAYLPTGPPFKVSQPDHLYLIPTIRVNVTIENVTTSTLVEYNDNQVVVNDITINILNQNIDNLELFGNNKIITGVLQSGDQVSYYGQASDANSPIPGTIGDIQANTDTILYQKSTNFNQFIYSHGAVQPLIKDSSMDFKYPTRGLNKQLPVLTKLPATINGNIISVSDDTLYMLETTGSPLQLSLETTSNIHFTRQIKSVCPKVSQNVLSQNGCSNCLQGLPIYFIAKSTCNSGMVDVSLECTDGIAQLLTNSIVLNIVDEEKVIYLRPTTDFVTCTITLTGDTSVSFEIDSLTPQVNETNLSPTENIINPPETRGDEQFTSNGSMNNWFSWLDSLGTIGIVIKAIIITVIIVVSLGIIGFLAKFLYNCYKK